MTGAIARARRLRQEADRDERGYVMFLTAVLLIPLIGIAAIGVDFGVWYLQASRNQAAADSAALAGAVWMPDQAAADAAINESLVRNGYQPGVDSTITIRYPTSSSVRVTVSTKSEQSFSRMFVPEFAISRASIGRYVPPTAIGSPTNELGSAGLWLAISGDCSVRENGDLRAALNVAGYPGAAYPPSSCAGGFPNPDYTGSYFLAVTIEQNPGVPVTVQVYDGTYAPSPTKTTDLEFRPPSRFDTWFTIHDIDGNVFVPDSGSVLATHRFRDNEASSDSQWVTIGTIPTPDPGTYYIEVDTRGSGGLDSFGSNGYAVRAFPGATYSSCSSRPSDADYASWCPRVSAVENLSLYASLSNGNSEFFLAEVPAEQKGKQLEVSLFDVGEGAERIEILDPDGNSVPFTWTTDCAITPPATPPGCSGTSESWLDPISGTVRDHTLNVAGSGDQIYASTLGTSLWNDRTVVITIDIPNDYDVATSGRWWKVRYHFGADITDRTTWSVRVIGDPVRLAG